MNVLAGVLGRDRGSRDVSYLISGALFSTVLRVLGVVASYGVQVLLSRSLGVAQYGLYAAALGTALVLAIPARMGFDVSALKYATVYLERRDPSLLKGFIVLVCAGVAAASLALGGVAFVILTRMSISKSPALGLCAAALILPVALLGVGSAFMRVARKIFASQFCDQILRPLLLIAGLSAWSASHRLTATSAMLLTAGAALAALAILIVQAAIVLGPNAAARPSFEPWRQWVGLAWPLLFISLTQELLNQLEVILLGAMGNAPGAGLFAAAWRLCSLVPFVLAALGSVGGPLIASAHDRGDFDQLNVIARLVARLSLGFALFAGLVLAVFGKPLLGVFGPGFTVAYPALLILLAGAVINAGTGIVAYLLTLTGAQRTALWIFGVALLTSAVLNLLLIPRFGVSGAAVASSTALASWNLAMLVVVRRRLGVDASALGLRRRVRPN